VELGKKLTVKNISISGKMYSFQRKSILFRDKLFFSEKMYFQKRCIFRKDVLVFHEEYIILREGVLV